MTVALLIIIQSVDCTDILLSPIRWFLGNVMRLCQGNELSEYSYTVLRHLGLS